LNAHTWVSGKITKIIESVNTYHKFIHSGTDKFLARPTSRCILFDGENISFDVSRHIYIYIYMHSTNIPPIMIINRIYETQNLLSL
jgi:hypothetical protein